MRKNVVIVIFLVFVIFIGFNLVNAYVDWLGAPWQETNYSIENETSPFNYNLSNYINASEDEKPLRYVFGEDTNISSTLYGSRSPSFFSWVGLNNTNGILSINSTRDNRTGGFNLTVDIYDKDDDMSAGARRFSFVLNATNDKPDPINLSSSYDFFEAENDNYWLNASDEEKHWPLKFNISWANNCTHASWAGRNNGENCSLFDFGLNLTNFPNKSAFLDFAPGHEEVGTYWGNITIMDNGENYSCPHHYCDSGEYEQNKTLTYPIKLNVFSSLLVNVSDCNNTVWQEGDNLVCNVTVYTEGENDTLSIGSRASLGAYDSNIENESWFYEGGETTSSNFTKMVSINVSGLEDPEVGNWSINFTVEDTTSNESESKLIDVLVNNTEDNVSIEDIPGPGSIYKNTTVRINATDEDLLVPDKSIKNESLNFSVNDSQDWVEVISTNHKGQETEARLFLNWDRASGFWLDENRTIRVDVSDIQSSDSDTFTVNISSDNPPQWNQSKDYNFSLVEDQGWGGLNFSGYVSDPDGDNITFYYENISDFGSLNGANFNSSGLVNFTPGDSDVGFYNLTVFASDSKLNATERIKFNISNQNDNPIIDSFNKNGVSEEDNFTISEGNLTKIALWVEDDDFKISQKDFYNESLTLDLKILNSTGGEEDLFSFSEVTYYESNNRERHATPYFTLNNSEVGEYRVLINITDKGGARDSFEINLSVDGGGPVLDNLTDQYSAVNRSLYYDLNATYFGLGSIVFDYINTSGEDILEGNFNSSTGEINISFNSSHAGKYHFNVTVNDTQGRNDSKGFWIKVYDRPQIYFPSPDQNFTGLVEGSQENLIFRTNHSVRDNLTYQFGLNEVVPSYGCLNSSNQSTCSWNFSFTNISERTSVSGLGNGSNFSWSFVPSFEDETYGEFKNLSLTVYPANQNLTNASNLNRTRTWRINISHANDPISFEEDIGDKGPVSYKSDIEIDLKNFFSDADYDDPYYSQGFSWSVNRLNPTSISTSISSEWVLTLSSSAPTVETLNITGFDLNLSSNSSSQLSNATSNNFTVEFTEPETKTITRTTNEEVEVPVLLKLVLPGPASMGSKDRINLPVTLRNNGEQDLEGISLKSEVAIDGQLAEDISSSFNIDSFDEIKSGESEEVSLIIESNTNRSGLFEITINASVDDPEYDDWGKVYLNVKEKNVSEIMEELMFTEEYIASNPECLEIKEIVERAREYFEDGDYEEARRQTNEALSSCKEAVSNPNIPEKKDKEKEYYDLYFLIATIFLFLMGLFYYVYKRVQFRRKVFG